MFFQQVLQSFTRRHPTVSRLRRLLEQDAQLRGQLAVNGCEVCAASIRLNRQAHALRIHRSESMECAG